MPNIYKINFLNEAKRRFGSLKKLSRSLSLFDLSNNTARLYIRYSKLHGKKSFYGLRKDDLKQLEGLNGYICFIWENQKEPLFVPYSDFEEIFRGLNPANDGQYKIQIYHQLDQTELYIANAGRFNVESFFGWNYIEERITFSKIEYLPDFSHSQIQTLLGSIGNDKGFDVWIPRSDRNRLDWGMAKKFDSLINFPLKYERIMNVIQEIDVIWVKRGSNEIKAIFEVEHSTPIYSGLLRFNDLHLLESNFKPRFSIVSNHIRRVLFLKQLNRPTFKASGLSEICNFLEYRDVYGWFNRFNK